MFFFYSITFMFIHSLNFHKVTVTQQLFHIIGGYLYVCFCQILRLQHIKSKDKSLRETRIHVKIQLISENRKRLFYLNHHEITTCTERQFFIFRGIPTCFESKKSSSDSSLSHLNVLLQISSKEGAAR